MSGTDDPGQPDEQVGSVSEEAVKLFGALSGWARDQGADPGADLPGGLGHGLSGLADQAARAAREVDEHLATGDAECTWCPICRTVHAVRRTSPEVRAHLALLQRLMEGLNLPDQDQQVGLRAGARHARKAAQGRWSREAI